MPWVVYWVAYAIEYYYLVEILVVAYTVWGNQQAKRQLADQQRAARDVYNASLRDRAATVIASEAPYMYVYGRARVGSSIVAMFTSGARDEYKHLVCVHAAHECDAFEEIYINGKALGTLDADGYAINSTDYKIEIPSSIADETHTTSSFTLNNIPVPASTLRISYTYKIGQIGQVDSITKSATFTLSGADVVITGSPRDWQGNLITSFNCHYEIASSGSSYVRVKKHLGTAGDPADTQLIADTATLTDKWTSTCTLDGFCYSVVTINLDNREFQGGVPSVEVLLRGKKIHDVRSVTYPNDTPAWSQNPASMIADYLTSEMCGVPAITNEQNGTALAGASKSLTLSATASVVEDFYSGMKLYIQSGTGAGQQRNVVTSRKNLVTYSQAFDNAAWTKNNCTIVANPEPAPDGSFTAEKLVSDNYTGRIQVTRSFSVTAGTKYTASIHAKAAEWSHVTVFADTANYSEGAYYGSTVLFDLNAGTFNATPPAGVTASYVGNGWYRLSVSATPTTTSFVVSVVPDNNSTVGVNAIVGDGVSGIYIWGAQFEVGSSPTEYIHTEASAAVGVAVDTPWLETLFSSADWTDAYWTKTATVTATNISDTSATAYQYLYKSLNIAVVGQPYVVSLLVSKDAIPNTTRFPMIRLIVPDAVPTQRYADVRFDTSTGTSFTTNTSGIVVNGSGVIDRGSEWLAWVSITNNVSVQGPVQALIYPAFGAYTTEWTPNVATIGSIDCRQMRLERGTYPTLNPDSTSQYLIWSVGDLPLGDYIAAANVCDESTAHGTKYLANGTVTAAQNQGQVLEAMAQSMAGSIVSTTWSVTAGKYVAPVLALTQSDIVGDMSYAPGTPEADLFNGVKGQYISAANSYVATDFAPYQNATYVTSDGDEFWANVDFMFTDEKQRVHDLCRIMLEDQRNGFILKAAFSYKAWDVQIGDRVTFTSTLMGQTAKVYRVMEKSFSADSAVNLTLKEDAATIWDLADAVTVDSTPNTNLPNPFQVGLCGNLNVVEELYQTSGSVGIRSKAKFSWTAPTDATVIRYEAEYKPYTSGTWIEFPNLTATEFEFLDLKPGVYDCRVKATNIFNIDGPYTAFYTFTINGLTTAPENVSGFSVAPMNGVAYATWTKTTSLDVKIGGKVVIRFCPLTSGASWEQAYILDEFNGDAVAGTLPLATGTYYAKFVDSTGHYSDTETSFVATEALVTGWSTVATSTQHTTFSGVKTLTYVDSGTLKLTGSTLWDDFGLIDDEGFIDTAGGVSTSGTYEFDSTMDLTTKASRRFHVGLKTFSYDTGDTIAQRGLVSTWPSVSGGVINDCDVTVSASVSDDNITYGPWTPFLVADFNCRYAKFKAQLTSAVNTHNIQVNELSVAVKIPA